MKKLHRFLILGLSAIALLNAGQATGQVTDRAARREARQDARQQVQQGVRPAPALASAQRSVAFCGKPDANFCPNNRFTNGNFEELLGDPNDYADNNIKQAAGWQAIWKDTNGTPSYADLYCPTVGPSGWAPPTGTTSVYASMWISNNIDPTYQEGMFNKLQTAILKNSGSHSFKFKTANVSPQNGSTGVIGIYGIKYDATTNPAPPNVPLKATSVMNLYGSANTTLLGQITISGGSSTAWSTKQITFSTANLASDKITHIMVTRLDGNPPGAGRAYMAFDDFCMQSSIDTGGINTDDTGVTDAGDILIGDEGSPKPQPSTCCPPLSGPTQLSNLFKITAHTVPNTSKIELDTTSAAFADYVAGFQAYYALLRYTCKSVWSFQTTFTLHTASAIGGNLINPPLDTMKVIFDGRGTGHRVTPQFTNAVQANQTYGIKATTVGLDANGKVVNCGFDQSCNKDARFTFSNNVGSRVKNIGNNTMRGMSIGK